VGVDGGVLATVVHSSVHSPVLYDSNNITDPRMRTYRRASRALLPEYLLGWNTLETDFWKAGPNIHRSSYSTTNQMHLLS